jgi:hypothetical protein
MSAKGTLYMRSTATTATDGLWLVTFPDGREELCNEASASGYAADGWRVVVVPRSQSNGSVEVNGL